jgi:hypothetical protein
MVHLTSTHTIGVLIILRQGKRITRTGGIEGPALDDLRPWCRWHRHGSRYRYRFRRVLESNSGAAWV